MSRYDGYTVGQLGLGYSILKAAGSPISSEWYRAMHAKAVKMVKEESFYGNHIKRDQNGYIKYELNPTISAEAVKALRAVNPMQGSGEAIKTNEVMQSDLASYGNDWVPGLWTPELWGLVRNEARVLNLFRQIEVPGESLTVPTVAGRTTVYKVGQTANQSSLDLPNALATPTRLQTSSVTLTPVKGMAWVPVAEEFIEDSIVPVLPTLQSEMALDLAEQIDEILISGDTDTANTNISDTGNGAIATSWRLLMVNGLRDYALANSNASDRGALTAEDFTAVMALLGTNGAFALDPAKLVWIVDPGVYRKLLTLGELITVDKAGERYATITNGRVTQVFGSTVVVSDKYGATDANGKIHNTAGNNTKGSFLLVRPDRWLVGFGRQLRIEVLARSETSVITDTRSIVASFRLDFKNSDEGSALGYNVTI